MLTISKLAKRYHISRASILYYERQGLLEATLRSDNGYRWYGEQALQRLEMILAYRSFGLSVADIAQLITQQGTATQERILQQQFSLLEQEIARLRQQQQAIVQLLQQPKLLEETMVTKQRWVEIMRAAGLSDRDMENWHRQFETMEPEAHQEFLQSLQIDSDEIAKIRAWSKG